MRILGGAMVGAALMLLAGCGSAAPESSYTPTVAVAPRAAPSPVRTPMPTRTPHRTAEPVVPPTTATSTAADAGRPEDQCPDEALGVTVLPGTSAGEYEVLFTNTGGEPCALRGTPVVAVDGIDGAQVGPAATRTRAGTATRTLEVGGGVTAPLRVQRISSTGEPLDGCALRHGRGWLVTPPHSTHVVVARDPAATACIDGPAFMTVGPVAAPRS